MSKQKKLIETKLESFIERGKNTIYVLLYSIVLNSVFYYRKKTESKDSTQVYIKLTYLSWSHLSK